MYTSFTGKSSALGSSELRGSLPTSDPRELLLQAGLFESADVAQVEQRIPDKKYRDWLLKGRLPMLQPAKEFGVVRLVGEERREAPIAENQFVLVVPKQKAPSA